MCYSPAKSFKHGTGTVSNTLEGRKNYWIPDITNGIADTTPPDHPSVPPALWMEETEAAEKSYQKIVH